VRGLQRLLCFNGTPKRKDTVYPLTLRLGDRFSRTDLERDDFRLGCSLRFKVTGALLWCEGAEELADAGAYGFEGACSVFAQQVLEL